MQTLALSPAVRLGRGWFRWRGFSPVPWFLLMAVLPADFSWSGAWAFLPLLGMGMAEAVRLWAVGYAGSSTRTRGDQVPQLVHAGPFRYVRNPLYLANIGLYTCCGLWFGFWGLSATLFFYSCLQYHFIVAYEESLLSQTFGSEYAEYCRRVPRWVPSLRPAIPSSGQSFELHKAVRSERGTFFVMAALAVAYLAKPHLL